MKKFDLDKFVNFFKEGNHPQRALLLSGQDKFGGPFKTNENDEYFLFSEYDKIEKDFKKLDKSFEYSPIIVIRDTPEPDDGLYYYDCEYGLLSSSKNDYSFLTKFKDYNVNSDLVCIKSFDKLDKDSKSKLSQIILKDIDKKMHYCKWIIMNNQFQWGSNSEYKKIMSKNDFPKSILKYFTPLLKNKKKFAKECGATKEEIKSVTSTMLFMSEKKIKKRQSIKLWGALKGEASHHLY